MRYKMIVMLMVLVFFILSTSANLSTAKGTQDSSNSYQGSSVLENNTAFLSGNISYYTELSDTSSGYTTIYSTDYKAQWYFTGKPVGTNLSGESKYSFLVGCYSYAGGNINVPMVFEPGIDSSGGFNIGTIYATLNVSSVNSGAVLSSSTWSEEVNLNSSSPGWSHWNPSTYLWAYIEPTFAPDVSEGFYSFSLSVAATPDTNYAEGFPGSLFTTPDAASSSGGGFIASNESVTLDAPTNVMLGFTYSGQSSSTRINLNDVYGANISFKSPYPVELKTYNKTSIVTSSGYIYFNSSSPINSVSLTFQNVKFPTNGSATYFDVEWYISDIITKNELKDLNFTSVAKITTADHWRNTTNPGGGNYSFKLVSPSNALNGKSLDGRNWDTTWSYKVFNLLDSGFGSPINNFYINYIPVPYPYKYNQVSGSIVNSGGGPSVYVNLSTENLVFSYPSFGPPIIYSANATPNPVQVGEVTHFWASVNWQGEMGNLTWEVGGNNLVSDKYIFHEPGSVEVNVTAKNDYGFSTLSFNVTVFELPVIMNLGSVPLNISIGERVNFTTSIDWYGANGTVVWQVDGTNLTGHSYIFNSSGTYTVTVIAHNKYGIVTNSFYVKIESKNHSFSDYHILIYSAIGVLGTGGLASWLFIMKRRKN